MIITKYKTQQNQRTVPTFIERKVNLNPKRIFDFTFSIIVLILLSPIFLIIAILIKLKSPNGTVFFKQKRVGKDGKIFNVYKFRTMVLNAEEKLTKLLNEDSNIKEEYITFRKLKNDPRIIPKIGNFLRKTSLDELPQFFNVFLGQMSVVGPRPYLKNEFEIYPTNKELNIVSSVKPGITGYWQIIPNRHDTTFENRVETDIEYINKKNFSLDLKIISKTVSVMILKRGA
jgi:lipopolysaccharide/colanic/teichoic acid biosynthesis glycosyltransferase